jgi:hypothetical protein
VSSSAEGLEWATFVEVPGPFSHAHGRSGRNAIAQPDVRERSLLFTGFL